MNFDEKDPLADLIGEFLDKKNSGQIPRLDDYLERCPGEKKEEFRKAISFLGKVGAEADSKANFHPSSKIGDYEIVCEIGRGGMGVVYEARQVSIQRKVALKLIAPWIVKDDISLGRMQREAQAIAKLRHPNIVTVYATGEEENIRYLAMEFVPGKGLDELRAEFLERGEKIPIPQLLQWMADIARALQSAHEAGVIHRDIKPSNIRITPEGQAILIDFGLASDLQFKTSFGAAGFRGSPYYASPEQVQAQVDGVGAQSDVYSLGVTLYECATGKLPFIGETTEQIFHLILSKEPPSPRSLNPLIPRDLDTVILTALEKELPRRYKSAGAFADDLEALLEVRPIQASPSSSITRTVKWVRRNQGWAAAIGVGFTAVLLLGVMFYQQALAASKIEYFRVTEKFRKSIAAGTELTLEDQAVLRRLLRDEDSQKAFMRNPRSPDVLAQIEKNLEEVTRGEEEIILLNPRASIRDPIPVFQMTFLKESARKQRYQLVLVSEKKAEQRVYPLTGGPAEDGRWDFYLPAGESLEADTAYLWTLRPENSNSQENPLGWVYFKVVSESTAKSWLNISSTGNVPMDKLLRATVMNQHHLAQDAIQELQEFPSNAPASFMQYRYLLLAEAFSLLNKRDVYKVLKDRILNEGR